MLRSRISDINIQNWHNEMEVNSHCVSYKLFKDNLRLEPYILGLWLRLECSLDSLSIVSTDHQIDRGLSVSLRLYEMCHVLVIV